MLQKTKNATLNESNIKLIDNPTQDFELAINAFLQKDVGKFGKYFALPNALVYRTIISSKQGTVQKVEQNVIALHLDAGPVGNSSILPLIGRTNHFGHESLNRGVTEVQTRLSLLVPMIPFSVFMDAGLSLNKMEIVDRGNEEQVIRSIENPKFDNYTDKKQKEPEFIDESVHFTGASLFRIEDSYFLIDIDRIEITHKLFNPFLTKVPGQPQSIQEAYMALKPQQVLDAEKQGKTVLRQGEWFLIPTDITPTENDRVYGDGSTDSVGRGGSDWWYYNESFKLQAGKNRPNHASHGFKREGRTFVKGILSHSGREHKDIILNDWHEVFANTAIESFTIEGDID